MMLLKSAAKLVSKKAQSTESTDAIASPPAAPTHVTPIAAAPGSTPNLPMLDVANLNAEQAVSALVEHADDMGASDLFFVSNEQHVAVLVRHLGLMHTIAILAVEHGKRCLAHVKATAGMDTSEKRRPADGRWIYQRANGHAVDLRINCMPTLYGEDMAMRMLDRDTQLYLLDSLGMTPQQSDLYMDMIHSPAGLVLITGPTGSGKSVTLYASLMHLNDGKRKINTIEDPIEYAIDGLRQSQVNGQIDLGFSDLLRSVLRQCPDIIMIGEIRDQETARTAVHAANSGMLVFATLHAPAAAGAVQSMLNLGVHPHFLSTSLRGVVGQRLVRTLCPKCKTSFPLEHADPFEEVRPWLAAGEATNLYAPKGCEECRMSGYNARTGVVEVLKITPAIRSLIAENRPGRDIHAKAVEEGMLQFRHAALLKVARGLTSIEEVFRTVPTEHLLLET
jgi:type II secretory ATPase GspE/PulE/Tfp pilus assembly ATPase PilB-like protein